MFSNAIKKTLVVASVALTLPVLSAGAALADSDHGQGKGRDSRTTSASDPSGTSSNPDGTFQGTSRSTPDQDGKGMDRGADNNDKTGPGTDGNNGCGNEPRAAAPRDGGRPTDDDNNGWCGSKPKPVHPSSPVAAPAPAWSSSDTSTAVVTAAAPVAAPAVTGTSSTSTVSAPAAPAAVPTGTSSGSASGAVLAADQSTTAGSGTVSSQSAAAPKALPFTGAPVGLLLLLGGLAVAAGALMTGLGRRRTA